MRNIQQWKRNAAIFLGSQAITLFGSSLVQFAITWYITLTTQSGVYMTVSIVCSFVPTLFISPFAGVWADRYDRKKLIAISDGVIALSTLVLALVFLSGYNAIWLLFLVSAIRGMGGAIQSPAVSALLPEMVPEEHLTRINGINGSVQSLLSLASPALGGALLALIGSIELIFFIDVVTAAIGIFVLLRFVRIPRRERPDISESTGYFGEIKQGLSYIRRHGYLMHLLWYVVAICFMVAPVAFLTPLQVVRSYGEEVWRITGIQIAFSGGMLAGGLLISVWKGLSNRIHMMGYAICAMGVSTMLLGMELPFPIYLALMAMGGMTMPLFNTPAIALLQERVDPAYMGRVFSVVSMVNSSMMPLGMFLFGPLADRLPIEWMLIFTGCFILLAAIILMLDKTVGAIGKSGVKTGQPT